LDSEDFEADYKLKFIGKMSVKSISKEAKKLESLIISISENSHFEVMRCRYYNEVDKFINYLKWSKEKYRISKVKLKPVKEVSNILNIGENSFGMQIKENSYIIRKLSVKLEIYAKISIYGKIATFNKIVGRRK
jgi:hypothetical protein